MALAVRGTGEKIRITVSAWAAGMAQASREWVQSGCRSDASRQRRCRAGGLKVLSACHHTEGAIRRCRLARRRHRRPAREGL
jgi:hypothetical protein